MGQRKLGKIIISGNPYSRGVQYGTKAKKLIEKVIEIYHSMFLKLSGVTWEEANGLSKAFAKRIKDYDEDVIDEMKGIAEGCGRTFEEILTINIRTEILFGMEKLAEGCTSFCALPEVTVERKILLAQNWDYKPWAAETMCLLQINQKDGPDILTIVEAGQLARMGMNSAGHGICNNFIRCETDGKNMEKGVPTTIIRRKALCQGKYYDLIGTIIHTPRSFSANYLVATSEGGGDSICIEATPEEVYFLFPENGMIVHSNHFKGAGLGYIGIVRKGVENSIYRDRRIERILRQKAGKIAVKDAMEALKDHFGYPRSVCRHLDEKEAEKDRFRTNASLIMDLGSRVLWLAEGPPCQNEYSRYTFDSQE